MEGFMDTSASFYDESIYQSPAESDDEIFSLSPSPESEWDSFGFDYFEQENLDLLQPISVQTQLPIPAPIIADIPLPVLVQPIVQQQQQQQQLIPLPVLVQPKPAQLAIFPTQSQPTSKASDELSVVVLQKKRGNGGVWQQIQQGERIRVDKTKGKLVKVLVKSVTAPINFADNALNVQLFLVDNARPDALISEGEGFAIAPSRPTKGATDESSKEFKLKLTKISKSQFFYVTVARLSAEQLSGRSLEFRSDDNGKVMNPKKRSRYAMESASTTAASPMIVPATRASSPAVAQPIFNTENFADFIARNLVPAILDSLPQLAPNVNTTILEDNITKRIKLAFPTATV